MEKSLELMHGGMRYEKMMIRVLLKEQKRIIRAIAEKEGCEIEEEIVDTLDKKSDKVSKLKEKLDNKKEEKELDKKKTNYALNQPNREAFIEAVLDGLTTPPKYFGFNVALNKGGYESVEKVINKGLHPISINDFEKVVEETEALILDTRSNSEFYKNYIPNSINIGLKGDFAPWVGAMVVDVKQPIILVSDPGTEEEVIIRLSRVGFDNVIGFLEGGFESWLKADKETDKIERIIPLEFANRYKENSKIIDVRKIGEYKTQHVKNAENKPLDMIAEWASSIDDSEHFFIHCAGGYRSMIAASILNAKGIRNFTEVAEGFNGIKKTEKLPLVGAGCTAS